MQQKLFYQLHLNISKLNFLLHNSVNHSFRNQNSTSRTRTMRDFRKSSKSVLRLRVMNGVLILFQQNQQSIQLPILALLPLANQNHSPLNCLMNNLQGVSYIKLLLLLRMKLFQSNMLLNSSLNKSKNAWKKYL